jgi:hypothetical protein
MKLPRKQAGVFVKREAWDSLPDDPMQVVFPRGELAVPKEPDDLIAPGIVICVTLVLDASFSEKMLLYNGVGILPCTKIKKLC